MIHVHIHVDPALSARAERARRWLGRPSVRAAALLAGLVVPTTLFASTVVLPHTFVGGSTASASEVNENFQALADAVNDNDARIAALEAVHPLPSAYGEVGYATTSDALGTLSGSFNSAGGVVTVTDPGSGYLVTFEDLSCPLGEGAATVVPYVSSTSLACRVERQEDNAFGNCELLVRCFDSEGSVRDGAISVLYVR
jgi:hypothetical protein